MIVSFEDFTPPARFDTIPWSEVRIEESDSTVLADVAIWTLIDTLALSPLDSDPATPEIRSFTTDQASATPDLWYRLTFADANGNVSLTSTPLQNSELVTTPYATTTEFFRVVRVTDPTDEQIAAAQGDLVTATIEINAEIDWADDHPPATAEQLKLMRNVCLNRAADLWRHRESAPGVLSIFDEAGTGQPGRYSFARYITMLTPLKDQWGVA